MAKSIIIKGKEWTKEKVKDLLRTNDKAVKRGLVLIYGFQTYEEQHSDTANTNNGQGFSKYDAEILSSMARQVQNGWQLSEAQLNVARKRIVKYAGQIYNYMEAQCIS